MNIDDVRVECIIHVVHFHSKVRYRFISFERDYKYRAASKCMVGTLGPHISGEANKRVSLIKVWLRIQPLV